MLHEFRLSNKDRSSVREVVVEIRRRQENLEESNFLNRAAVFAQQLPIRIREILYEFKLREKWPVLLITNSPVLVQDVGPTPAAHWRDGESRTLSLPQMIHGLYSSLLGEPFGFETQQRGRIFNDLISIPGAPENSSSGMGLVGLHTEDAFRPFMPDYLGLMCLRNDQRAATTFSSLQSTDLTDSVLHTLLERPFPLKNAECQTILFGDSKRPYLRYAAGPIDYQKCDQELVSAMEFLTNVLQQNVMTTVLNQGDCLYLDNFMAVHGRAPFQATYGATSRWFCRLVMLRDLRRTRRFRAGPEARVMLKNTY
jgi:hypothetical protein